MEQATNGLFPWNVSGDHDCQHSQSDAIGFVFPSRALIPSHYRRIQRFFHHHRLDYDEVARFGMKLFGFMDIDSLLSLAFKTMKYLISNYPLPSKEISLQEPFE